MPTGLQLVLLPPQSIEHGAFALVGFGERELVYANLGFHPERNAILFICNSQYLVATVLSSLSTTNTCHLTKKDESMMHVSVRRAFSAALTRRLSPHSTFTVPSIKHDITSL